MGIEIRPHDLPVDPPTEKELEKRSRKLFGNIEAILSRIRGFGKSRRSRSARSKRAKSATKSKVGSRSRTASKKASKTASKKASFNKVFVGDVSRMSSGPAGKKKTLKKKKVKKLSSVNKKKVKSPGSNGKSMRSFYSKRRSKFGKKK